jgi:transposase InsO family protein
MVVGWALSATNDRHLALRALEQALRRRCPESGLLHHTDQGSPYASEDYQRVLAAHGIVCSMSRRGSAYDNAAMESWFSTMTFELGDRFETHASAKTKLFDYIEVFCEAALFVKARDEFRSAFCSRSSWATRAPGAF